MLPILEELRQISDEAQKISEHIDELIAILNIVSDDTEEALNFLLGFIEYAKPKLEEIPSQFTLLNRDAKQLMLELETAICESRPLCEIHQTAQNYSAKLKLLHKKLLNIRIALID